MFTDRDQIRDVMVGATIVTDLFSFSVAASLAYYVRLGSGFFDEFLIPSQQTYLAYTNHFLFGLVLFLFLGIFRGIFNEAYLLRPRLIFPAVLKICTYWAFIYLFFSFFFRLNPQISRSFVLINAVLSIPIIQIGRLLLLRFFKKTGWAARVRRKVLFIGQSDDLTEFIRDVNQNPSHPFTIAGWLELASAGQSPEFTKIPNLGNWQELESVLGSTEASTVILAESDARSSQIESIINICARMNVKFMMLGTFYPFFASGIRVQMISNVPLLGIRELPIEQWHNRLLKRFIDICGACVGLVCFSPLILIFAVIIYLESPGPVFYRQTRSGKSGKPFQIYKIRSMKLDAEKHGVGWSTKNDPRKLKAGAWIRRWNIDELPQFWNVLKGEMSLVGPRPERPELIEKFKYQIKLYNIRHDIKPGITGWAQIHGWRGDTNLVKRIKHDLYYMENWSIWMDIYIMIATFFRFKNAA